MRREIPTTVAIVVILAVLVIVAFLFWRVWTGRRQLPEEAIKLPAEVQQEFQKRMGGVTPPIRQ